MFNFHSTLFSISLPNKEVKNNALVMTGCNAYIQNFSDIEHTVYSEFEELNYSYLNKNDYESYRLEIEFCFENSLDSPYHWFYAGCFSIRTDNGVKIKLNGNPSEKCLTKINMENKMVLGIGLFFKSNEEYTKILNSEVILIEGFIALDEYNNTFGISSKIIKDQNKWKIVFANTYKMDKKDDIRKKVH